jgi:hypothetical protein
VQVVVSAAPKARGVLQPKNANEAAAAPEAPKQQGRQSMSALLERRSEAATYERKRKVQPASPLPDIDSCDKDDPLAAADYVSDIFSYYRRVEPQYRVSPDYMSSQVNWAADQGRLFAHMGLCDHLESWMV